MNQLGRQTQKFGLILRRNRGKAKRMSIACQQRDKYTSYSPLFSASSIKKATTPAHSCYFIMVGRALLEHVKTQVKQLKTDARMNAAIEEYRQEQRKPDGVQKRGYRPIADAYGVSSSALQRLVNGGISQSASNAMKRKLTITEEHVLRDFILKAADRALPLGTRKIEEHANAILQGREHLVECVGVSWVGRFLDRYQDELQTHWSRPLATECARSLNKESVKHWFKHVQTEVIEKGVKEHNIYGMDESGFPPSNQGVERVVGRRGTKVQHKAGSANRENVTVLVTICADGTALAPTIIFKGKRILKKWGENNVSQAS